VSTKTEKPKRPGHKPEWSDLPARRCDNCGKVFKPKQPHQRFHTPQCRWQADRLGPGYARLKVKLEKDIGHIRNELFALLRDSLSRAQVELINNISKRLARIEGRLTPPVKGIEINESPVAARGEQI
jgi:hypothetical protein